MEKYNVFIPDILSKREELLTKVINCKVISMTRYGLEPKEKFSLEYYGLEEEKAFSLSEGVLVIEFDNGISIGFSSDEEICSVIMWAESYCGQNPEDQLRDDMELFPISAADTKYSNEFFSGIINQTMVRYEIIKQEPRRATYYSLPREVGLCLIFSNGSQMIVSHQLTKEVPDDFTILEWEQVDEEVYSTLYKTSRFWK